MLKIFLIDVPRNKKTAAAEAAEFAAESDEDVNGGN